MVQITVFYRSMCIMAPILVLIEVMDSIWYGVYILSISLEHAMTSQDLLPIDVPSTLNKLQTLIGDDRSSLALFWQLQHAEHLPYYAVMLQKTLTVHYDNRRVGNVCKSELMTNAYFTNTWTSPDLLDFWKAPHSPFWCFKIIAQKFQGCI
jgi:hypothetical protein